MFSQGKEKGPLMLGHETASFPSLVGVDLQDTTHNSIMILDDLQAELDRKFYPKKLSSQELAQVYKVMKLNGRFMRVYECGSYLEYYVSDSEKKLHRANFCKDRLCPMCNWRRSLKIFSQVSKVMDKLESDGYQFLFLTLTVKNCSAERLPDTCQTLFDGWRKLYHKKSVFQKSIVGTFRSLEVTLNRKTGEFHPHLHVILAVTSDYFHKGYISQACWCALWRSCCDLDYDPIIDVRKIKPGSNGLSGAVAEVSKYAVKSVDFLQGSIYDRVQYVSAFLSALTGRRLCSFTGIFDRVRKQLALDDVENGDLIHVDTDDFRSDLSYLVVRYAWKAGFYVLLED